MIGSGDIWKLVFCKCFSLYPLQKANIVVETHYRDVKGEN